MVLTCMELTCGTVHTRTLPEEQDDRGSGKGFTIHPFVHSFTQ